LSLEAAEGSERPDFFQRLERLEQLERFEPSLPVSAIESASMAAQIRPRIFGACQNKPMYQGLHNDVYGEMIMLVELGTATLS
jgi:capsid protein